MNLKRLAFALLITSGMLLLLMWHINTQQPATKPAEMVPASRPTAPAIAPAAPDTEPAVAETLPSAPASGWWDDSTDEAETFVIGSADPKSDYLCYMELTSKAAAVSAIRLSKYFTTVRDKQRFKKDPATYEQAVQENPDKYKGHYSLVGEAGNSIDRTLSFTTRRLLVEIPQLQEVRTFRLERLFWRVDPNSLPAEGQAAEGLTFTCTLYHGESPDQAVPFLEITKTYTLRPNSYSFSLDLGVKNLSKYDVNVGLEQLGPTGLSREDYRVDMRKIAYGKLQPADKVVQIALLNPKKLAKKVEEESGRIGQSDGSEPVLWIGSINKFFGSMMYLVPAVEGRLEAPTWGAKFLVDKVSAGKGKMGFVPVVKFPSLQLAANESKTVSLDIFAGPKKREIFVDEDADHFSPLYKQLNYVSTIDFGRCCTWSPLSLGMMWLLQKLSTIALGNYGVAIIVLVALVRLALHPLTKRGQVSMMKMQKLGPQMQKLKEKYANDKNTLKKETMQLYKQAGASPFLGCLPMVLQMPIWIALWTGVNAAVELRHAAFLPVWITDLSAPDALFTWSQPLPLIGNVFNLLPILLMVAMFLQTKLNPQTAQAAASPDQAKQQKMMMLMMPVMMLFFFYKAPSGLTLYIMASTVAGVAEQYVIRRHIRAREAAEAAMEVTVSVPGKGPRSARPKKPKGPLWVKKG